MTKNENSTRFYSHKQEEAVAKLLNGKLEADSGAGKWAKGDVICKDSSMLCECKTCMKEQETFNVKKEWIEKNQKEKREMHMSNGCIAFNFGPGQENYFVINENLMKYLIEKLEEDFKEI